LAAGLGWRLGGGAELMAQAYGVGLEVVHSQKPLSSWRLGTGVCDDQEEKALENKKSICGWNLMGK